MQKLLNLVPFSSDPNYLPIWIFSTCATPMTHCKPVTLPPARPAGPRFHLAIAEASHNTILLHTIRGLFDLLKRNVVTNIGGMYELRPETRLMLISQHRELFEAITEHRADDARASASRHIGYVQTVLAERREEEHRLARAQRRDKS